MTNLPWFGHARGPKPTEQASRNWTSRTWSPRPTTQLRYTSKGRSFSAKTLSPQVKGRTVALTLFFCTFSSINGTKHGKSVSVRFCTENNLAMEIPAAPVPLMKQVTLISQTTQKGKDPNHDMSNTRFPSKYCFHNFCFAKKA